MVGIMVAASTGVMNSVLGKLATLMGGEFAKLKNLRKEVKFISDELIGMKDALEGLSYLDDLDPQTKRWRDIVREMSYDIENIIDDFMENIGESCKTTGFVSRTIGCLKTWRTTKFVSNTIKHLKNLRTRHNIVGQIGEIKALVLETSARRQRYKLDILPSNNVVIDPRVTTLYENAGNLVGVEAPTNELVNFLDGEEKQLKMVSIVGFGGLGKTTLANVVYNKMKSKFDLCAFVSVSQKPNISKLLQSLLYQLGGTTSSCEFELNVILDDLRKHLQEKRYMIVIDDIWDVPAWDVIKCAFPENNLGSRVIVTTRIRDVAKACCSHGSDYILEMKPLTNGNSRKLFLARIFGSEEACPSELSVVLVEILKRCGGLPLAIISISSMLASECSNQKERWEHVRDSLGSVTNLTLERMRQILNLSYKDLPSHLRTCFLYLGMYPEDYKIDRFNLERQWMAEGFISKQDEQDVENVARSYFNELVNRSLIQPVVDNRGSVTGYTVHDMMLDLILVKSSEENFFTILDDPRAIIGLDYKIHRLSIHMKNYDDILFPANICMSQVRTIMLFGRCSKTFSLSEFKFLRVLFCDAHDNGGAGLTGLSKLYAHDNGGAGLTGLSKLYHLRYLHVSDNIQYEIPTHISVLQHLETLHMDNYPSHGKEDLWEDVPPYHRRSSRNQTSFDTLGGRGRFANLRYLVLLYSHPDFKEKGMDDICSSLGRLGSLEDLLAIGRNSQLSCIDGLLPFSPPPTPYRLHTLVTPYCWFSRVPSLLGELRYLVKLECMVFELLADGLGVLADLPLLSVLDVNAIYRINEMIVFPGKAFPSLQHFKLQLRLSKAYYLTFQPGTMPKLQGLELKFWASESKYLTSEVAPAGLEHLLALSQIFVCTKGCIGAHDNNSMKSAFTSAVRKHPGNPYFHFSS